MKLKAPPTDYKNAASLRGGFVIRQTRWGLVAQAWPRRRPDQKKPYQKYQQAEFAYASRWACNPEPIEYQTAIALTKDTLLVPRDMLVMASFANAFEFIMPDGSTLTRFRDVAPNPQYVLDLITELVGSMIVRTNDGWVGLGIGNDGDVLTVVDQVVTWAAPTGGGGGGTFTQQMTLGTQSSSAFATKGNVIEVSQDVTIESVAAVLTTFSTDTYALNLVELTGNVVSAIVDGPHAFTTATNGACSIFWKVASRPRLLTGHRYAILCTRTNGAATSSLPMYLFVGAAFGIPQTDNSQISCTLAANAVAVGATLNLSGAHGQCFALPLTVTL